MTYGSVSPKFQIVIPKSVRKIVPIKPGQKLLIYAKDNVIYLVPQFGLNQLKGLCKGMDVSNVREDHERP
ncbi:MAG: AbrB/MazE/SpoVT family DNA-binding domain-containing protein [Deltaproteobacteria bacterium]|nr:AbrB/MazE/SpoVT family DNA-binding domain-containing protein [Deltaproteobacteria bacterium]